MKIRTTHVGSLPREPAMLELIFARERGEADPAAFDAEARAHVFRVAARQRAVGIDIVSDGESAKLSYATYVKERLTGFSGDSPRRPPADLAMFPGYLKRLAEGGGTPAYARPQCTGEVRMRDLSPLRRDIRNLLDAAEKSGRKGAAFMNAVSPGTIALFHPNAFYPDDAAYVAALAEAMRPEYEAIAESGLLLQVDCPDLALARHMAFAELDDDGFLAAAARRVAALNRALRGVAAERCRMHVCWGNYEGPHVCDIALARIFPLLMEAKPAAILFEAANPRHAHEWRTAADLAGTIPAGKILVPGVVDTCTNYVEHPELVAERLTRFAEAVGPGRLMAGTDCGFGTFAGFGAVHPDIAWVKLEALVQGAALASERLK